MTWTGHQVADAEWRHARAEAMSVRCPHCGAAAGRTCTNPSTGRDLRAPAHPARLTAAREQQP